MYGTRLMQVPQFGIFAQGTIAHEFIEFDLRPDVEMTRGHGRPGPAARARRVGRRHQPGDRLRRGAVADGRARPGARGPAAVHAHRPVGGHHAPATQHDFWLWISGSSQDVVFEHARAAVEGARRGRRSWPPSSRASCIGTARPDRLHRRLRQPDDPRGARGRADPRGPARRGRQPRPGHALGPRPRRLRAACPTKEQERVVRAAPGRPAAS